MAATILRKSHRAVFDFMRGCMELSKGKGNSTTPDSRSLELALQDLRLVQGEALIIGGLAVGYHGHERATHDIDILYANYDTRILERLKLYFKLIKKSKSGWHHLEHRKTGVRLELIPEGGLTTYGFIPGPKTLGRDGGFISFLGLVWLKMVSGRGLDEGDLLSLCKHKLDQMVSLREKLPPELHERYDALLVRAQREMAVDPDLHDPPVPPDSGRVLETPPRFGKKAPRRLKARA